MILAAGKGSRLAPLTESTPKPLLPVLGEPLIFTILNQLKLAGVQDIVINTHHLAEQIESALGDGESVGMRIRYSRETDLLETGGGIKKALPLLRDPIFWLCNGDIYCDFDFTKLPLHLGGSDLAHLVLAPKPSRRETGDFSFSNGRITARGGDYVYGGIATLHRDLFAQSPDGAFSLRDLLFQAVAQGKVAAQVHTSDWTDIGTLADYHRISGSTNAP